MKALLALVKGGVSAVVKGAALSVGNGLLSLTSGVLAASMIGYSGFVIYDTAYTQNQARSVSAELLSYRPTIIDSEEVPLSGSNLALINDDYRAWLTIHDTAIDYPVVQGQNDLYYASHDIYKNSSLTGAIYVASANSPDFSDSYNLIYGHHMDQNIMFGALDRYLDESYLNSHRTGILVTNTQAYNLTVFAVAQTDAYEQAFYRAGDRMVEVTAFLRDPGSTTTVTFYDENVLSDAKQIVALSTCASATTNGRLVVLAAMKERFQTMSYIGHSSTSRNSGVPGGPSPDRRDEPDLDTASETEPMPPEEMPEGTPGEPGGGIPGETPSGTPGEPGGSTPDSTPGEPGGSTPDDTPREPGGSTPDDTPREPGRSTPDGTPREPGGSTPDDTPGIPGGSTPDDTPGIPGGSTPDGTPVILGGGTLQETPEGTPSEPGGGIPGETPSGTPENRDEAWENGGENPDTPPELTEIDDDDTPLARFTNRFQPRGISYGGRAWALVNLLALFCTAYLLLPLLHLRAKYCRVRTMKKMNRMKAELRTASNLDEEELAERLLIHREAVEEKAREEGRDIETAVREAEAGGFAEITQDDFSRAVETLYYHVKKYVRRFRLGVALELALVALAAYVFVHTEDIRLPMILIDKWTPLMLLFLILCWLADIGLAQYRDKLSFSVKTDSETGAGASQMPG